MSDPDFGEDPRTGPARGAGASGDGECAPAPAGQHPDAPRPPIDRRMLEALVCPVTQGRLSYDPARGELVSKAAHLAFPIRNGIPIMLIDEAREID